MWLRRFPNADVELTAESIPQMTLVDVRRRLAVLASEYAPEELIGLSGNEAIEALGDKLTVVVLRHSISESRANQDYW